MDIDQWLDSLEPTGPARDAKHIRRINAAVDELDAAVAAAREAGDPWSVIALALGISEQAALERFG
ncbi:hypothetical protein BN1232_02238 [Mycobacterium lentiflavum]|uniref:Uncharacterized protein n=1 Tax=Mycobacterium lentiflavum TaxID=141349 RepID=A0A0E4GX52_MYCLN|nr:hypothetical protein [Mycobacterium lentiflavum]ULP44275.1 hypothetical protein MJO58_10215 [Mycobacterium lentiflavum]CQD11880.1 hypothetical protein BN1232_02238 [Mycobacterium lentiflavum]